MEPEPLLRKNDSFQLGRFKHLKAQWYLLNIKHFYIIKIQYPYVPTNKPTRGYYIWGGNMYTYLQSFLWQPFNQTQWYCSHPVVETHSEIVISLSAYSQHLLCATESTVTCLSQPYTWWSKPNSTHIMMNCPISPHQYSDIKYHLSENTHSESLWYPAAAI